MLARHQATHEAMNGDALLAGRVAASGIWRAVRASKEANPRDEHLQFVKKQYC
ncbi:MAG: hypothetical protein ACREGF_01515 [Candidatus Saccharimonadales bacterium]